VYKIKRREWADIVVPLLKVEVIMDGHTTDQSGQMAMAAWMRSHESGTTSDLVQSDKGFFEREQWKMLTDVLQGSVIQLFSASCESSDLAANFERHIDTQMPETNCSCYLGARAKGQEDYVYSNYNPFFNSVIPDEGRTMRASNETPNAWAGASNAIAMQPSLYNKHREAILTPQAGRHGNQFKTTLENELVHKRNPLMNFVWNSADLLAEETLEALRDADQGGGATARAILDAQFMHELPPNLPSRVVPADEVKEAYERVIARIAAIERSYEPLLRDSKGRLDSSVLVEEYAKFAQ